MKKFFITFKEELLGLPLLFFSFWALSWVLSWLFPNSAFFDLPSEIETLYARMFFFVVGIACATFGFRLAFPKMFRFLFHDYYHNFDEQERKTKIKWAMRTWWVFLICMALTGSGRGQAGDNLPRSGDSVRAELAKLLESQLGIREVTPNRGPEIDRFLLSVGMNPPASWCAAMVSYNLTMLGVKNPNSAWSPDFARIQDIIWTPKNRTHQLKFGDVPTFWNSSKMRVGHVGFYLYTDKSGWFITEEGNTNGGGSFDGDGQYMKKRDPAKIYAISRYID